MPPWWVIYARALHGHRWHREERGEPVAPAFLSCIRCGKRERPPRDGWRQRVQTSARKVDGERNA